jgi:hypothetical protein
MSHDAHSTGSSSRYRYALSGADMAQLKEFVDAGYCGTVLPNSRIENVVIVQRTNNHPGAA